MNSIPPYSFNATNHQITNPAYPELVQDPNQDKLQKGTRINKINQAKKNVPTKANEKTTPEIQNTKSWSTTRIAKIIIIGILVIICAAAMALFLGNLFNSSSTYTSHTHKYGTQVLNSQGHRISVVVVGIHEQNTFSPDTQTNFQVVSLKDPKNKRMLTQSEGSYVSLKPVGFVTDQEKGMIMIYSNPENQHAVYIQRQSFVQDVQKNLPNADKRLLLEIKQDEDRCKQTIRNKYAEAKKIPLKRVRLESAQYVNITMVDGKFQIEQTAAEINQQGTSAKGNIHSNSLDAKSTSTTASQKAAQSTQASTLNKNKEKPNAPDEFYNEAGKKVSGFLETSNKRVNKFASEIQRQAKIKFKPNLDIVVSQDIQISKGQSNIYVTRIYQSIHGIKPKVIDDSQIIPKNEFEALKHCFQHTYGRFCEKNFLNSSDNPYKPYSQPSRNSKYKIYIIYKITVEKEAQADKKDTKQKKSDIQVSNDLKSVKKNNHDQNSQSKPLDKNNQNNEPKDSAQVTPHDTQIQSQYQSENQNQNIVTVPNASQPKDQIVNNKPNQSKSPESQQPSSIELPHIESPSLNQPEKIQIVRADENKIKEENKQKSKPASSESIVELKP